MKRIFLFMLVLGLLLLCSCSSSDSPEADMPSASEGVQSQESGDSPQTEPENILESQDPAGTDSETSAVSDRNETGEESTPSADRREPGESAPAKQQTNSSKSEKDSQAPAGLSEPKQNESAVRTEEPKETVAKEPVAKLPAATQPPAPEPAAPEKPAAEPVEELPAVTQPPAPEPVALKEPVQPSAEPEKPKTIYDYAFDTGAIRSELIAIGQSMGLTHITEDDGIPCTPDTCSWAAPVTASESFQGDRLKRALKDYVTSMPSVVASYGGAQLTSFTIYVQDNGGGSYTFYFLY